MPISKYRSDYRNAMHELNEEFPGADLDDDSLINYIYLDGIEKANKQWRKPIFVFSFIIFIVSLLITFILII